MNWRPIKTAPKEGRIIGAEPDGSGGWYVNEMKWVEVPHNDELMKSWREGGERNADKLPRPKGQWMEAHIAILEHGGACDGKTWDIRNHVCWPTKWMPMPKGEKPRRNK